MSAKHEKAIVLSNHFPLYAAEATALQARIGCLRSSHVVLQLPQHLELRENLGKTQILKEDYGFGHRFVQIYHV